MSAPDEINVPINQLHHDAASITASTMKRWIYGLRFFMFDVVLAPRGKLYTYIARSPSGGNTRCLPHAVCQSNKLG